MSAAVSNAGGSFRSRLLVEALAVLAEEAADQLRWVDEHGVVVDELALDFEHALRVVGDGCVDHEVMAWLREIDVLFDEMNDACWTREALAVDAGWQRARRLARECLVRLCGGWEMPLPEIVVVR